MVEDFLELVGIIFGDVPGLIGAERREKKRRHSVLAANRDLIAIGLAAASSTERRVQILEALMVSEPSPRAAAERLVQRWARAWETWTPDAAVDRVERLLSQHTVRERAEVAARFGRTFAGRKRGLDPSRRTVLRRLHRTIEGRRSDPSKT